VITIDGRQGSSELAPLFPHDIPTTISHLDYGDFYFMGHGPDCSYVSVGVERKAIKDLLNSMTTGRLSGHQLPGLTQQYEYVYLLVEGLWRFNPISGVLETMVGPSWQDACLGGRRFMAKEIVGFLNTLAIKAGIQVVYTHSQRETVQTIVALYHWWNSKNWDQHDSHLAPHKVHKGAQGQVQLVKPSLVRRIAAELPLIGWGKSLAVAEYFPSVRIMMTATEQQWRDIPGIGKGIAKGVVDEINKIYTKEDSE
jgi:ERCC4-type nuclease